MKIKTLTLYSQDLERQKDFYGQVLGFEIVNDGANKFSVQVGFTELTFEQSHEKHPYHYCFLIPSNKLNEAQHWFSERLDLIKIEGDRTVQQFDSWNADSIYFYDGAGNLAECIVRYDLENQSPRPFENPDIIGVNEIGMPTSDIFKINESLEMKMGSMFWKGDRQRFGTNGSQEGLFLLVNSEVKKSWFPTDLPTASSPFGATVEVDNRSFEVKFQNQEIEVLAQ